MHHIMLINHKYTKKCSLFDFHFIRYIVCMQNNTSTDKWMDVYKSLKTSSPWKNSNT